ncbi:MAG: hypothetical protein EBR34_16420, partial [Sphingomonadaceae bacterium]|nr:hypothetical protein [Sphingomonadaceae bacterium]
MAEDAINRGIPLRAGQIADSRLLRAGDSEMSSMLFGGNAGSNRAIQEGYNRAAGKLMGEDATRLTPEVIDRAYVRIGDTMDSLYPRLGINSQVASNELLGKLATIESEAKAAIAPEGAHPIVTQIGNILDKASANNGAIPGEIYHSLIKRGSPLDRATQNIDPDVRYYARQVRNALDDAVEISLPAGSPALAQFREAKAQYRALKQVQESLTPDGDVSGPRLAATVKREMGDAYHR